MLTTGLTRLTRRAVSRVRVAAPQRGLSSAKRPAAQGIGARGPVTWGTLIATSAAGGALLLYYESEKERRQTQVSKRVKSVGKPALGGPWTLVDTAGQAVTDAQLRGEFLLLYFGFTRCPDICPSELVKMGEIIDGLDERFGPVVRPVFISVDPPRDTVAQLRAYSRDFHRRILFLTGTPAQVAKATRAYRVYFSEAGADVDEADDDYLVDHSIVLYLVGRDGEFLEFFTQSTTAEECVVRASPYLQGD